MHYLLARHAVWRGLALLAAALAWGALAPDAQASRLILRIKAVNPVDEPQVVSIRSNLPQGIGTNDVLNLDGLELGYDVRNDVYYVHKDVQLGPKQVQTYNVELDDVWVVPAPELVALSEQAQRLAGMLRDTPFSSSAGPLQQQVTSAIERIGRQQAQNAIGPGVQPMQHIGAYEENLKLLARARRDVGHLENMALETGRDPGQLLGEDRRALAARRDAAEDAAELGLATIRVTVRNTSPTETRTVDVRRELPAEIGLEDVVDAGGLTVGVDPATGATTVFLSGVELGPGAGKTFAVQVRDKWNVNVPRLATLSGSASNLLTQISAKQRYASVEGELTAIMDELGAARRENGPSELGPDYVAFYRGQAKRTDELEQRINRVRAALYAIEKTNEYGFDVPKPSLKTTWLIIYVILGFLAFISLLFFLRWYGRTRDEQMWDKLSREGGERTGEPPSGAASGS